MAEKKTVSIYISQDLIEEFDNQVWEYQYEGKLERDVSRSEIIQQLMANWVEESNDGVADVVAE